MGLHWSNSPEGSATSAGREFTGYKEVNEAIFIVTGGFFLVGIVPVLIFGGNRGGPDRFDPHRPLAVIALAAWGAPRIAYAKVIEKDPRCVCRACRETVHPSRSFLNRHSRVSYRDVTQGERASLIFSIIQLVVLNILC